MSRLIQKIQNYNWKNWWYYHWAYVLMGALVLAGLVWFLSATVFRSDPEADYHVGYAGSAHLDPAVTEQLEYQLAALAPDLNGDGQTLVELHDYVLDVASDGTSGVSETDLSYLYQLAADGSYIPYSFWIVEKPEAFQLKFELLKVHEDGSFGDTWKQNRILSGLQLDAEDTDWQSVLADCTIAAPWTGGEDPLYALIMGE